MAVTGSRQRGAALLMAMIIVTLIATLSTTMVWQQWRAVQVEAAERARAQSGWVLGGALDWARLILREDGRGNVDHLGEPWAVPLQESRLTTFLATDKDHTDDGPEAFLSGVITDAQAKFNLRNLVDAQGKIVEAQLKGLERLFSVIGLDPSLADRIAKRVELAAAPGITENATLMPQSVEQLAWFELTDDVVARMAPYVVVLPVAQTKINLNTAPREVLASVKGLELSSAERLVQARKVSYFKDVASAQAQVGGALQFDEAIVGVRSDYFEVRGRLRVNDRVLEETSLVWRQSVNSAEVRAITRRRDSVREIGR